MPCQARYIGFSHRWVVEVKARGVRIGSPAGFVACACATVISSVAASLADPAQQPDARLLVRARAFVTGSPDCMPPYRNATAGTAPVPPSHGASTVMLMPWVRLLRTVHEAEPSLMVRGLDCHTVSRPSRAWVSRKRH